MKLLRKQGLFSLKAKFNWASSVFLDNPVPRTPYLFWPLSGTLVSSPWKSLSTKASSLLLLLYPCLHPQPGKDGGSA